MLLPPLLALLASLLSGLSLYTAIFVLLIGKFQLINKSTILWLRSVLSHRKKSLVKRCVYLERTKCFLCTCSLKEF
jgi:hypothetical protein